jgi:tetratricopeptide (TPR) repeat protein
VAKDQRAMLVDFESKLGDLSLQQQRHSCFGGEYFLDHVHPTIGIHRQLAIWILETLLDANWMEGKLPSDAVVAEVSKRLESSIRVEDQGIAFRNLAKVLHWAGKFEEAIPRARDAIRLMPADPESRFVLADCYFQLRKLDQARDEYEALLEVEDYPRAYLPYAELLMDQREFEAAKPYLMGAILSERKEEVARAYYDLGMVDLQLGEFQFAVESLRECDRLFPNDPATLSLIAEVEWARGNGEIARKELSRVTEIVPDNFYAHYRLAEILMDQERIQEAKPHVDAAIQLEPSNESAKSLRARWERLQESPEP